MKCFDAGYKRLKQRKIIIHCFYAGSILQIEPKYFDAGDKAESA